MITKIYYNIVDEEPFSSQASIDTSGSLKAKDGSTIHYRLSGVVFFNVTDEYRTEITGKF